MLQIRFDTENKYEQLKEVFVFYDRLVDIKDYEGIKSRRGSINSGVDAGDDSDSIPLLPNFFNDPKPIDIPEQEQLGRAVTQRRASEGVDPKHTQTQQIQDFSKSATFNFTKKAKTIGEKSGPSQPRETREHSEDGSKEMIDLKEEKQKPSPDPQDRLQLGGRGDSTQAPITKPPDTGPEASDEGKPSGESPSNPVPPPGIEIKFRQNLKIVQKSERILTKSPKLIIETSQSKFAPSIGKISVKRAPKVHWSRRLGLKILVLLAPIVSRLSSNFSLSRSSQTRSQESYQDLARSIGLVKKKLRYQPKFRPPSRESDQIYFSFFAILKWFLFLKILFIIVNLQTNFLSDSRLRVLSLVFLFVAVLEREVVHLGALLDHLLGQQPNYLVLNAEVDEPSDLSRVLDLRLARGGSRDSRGRRARGKSRKMEKGITLKNMPEVSFAVKTEFIFKNLVPVMKSIAGGRANLEVKTAYRNNRVMFKSPETDSFEYLGEQAHDLLTDQSDQGEFRQLINPRQDVIYILFERGSAQGESASEKEAPKSPKSSSNVEKIFKIKYKKNSLKIEYFGFIDSEIVTSIQKFRMEYENFIKCSFLKKCLQKANEDTPRSEIQSTLEGDLESKKSPALAGGPQEARVETPAEPTQTGIEKQSEEVDETRGAPKRDSPPEEPVKDETVKEIPILEKPVENAPIQVEPVKKEVVQSAALTEEDKLKRECRELADRINMPHFNFDIAAEFNTKRELLIAKRFLEVVQTYWGYYDDEQEWTVSDKQKEYTAWARNDGRFVVRKAEMTSEIDIDLFEKIMKNYDLAPKWNPLLGRRVSNPRQSRTARGAQSADEAQSSGPQNALADEQPRQRGLPGRVADFGHKVAANSRKLGVFFDAEEKTQKKYAHRKYVRGITDMIIWDISKVPIGESAGKRRSE